MPVNFQIKMLPAFFNSIDSERIGTVINTESFDFLINTGKKVLFSVGVKIFPYGSEINSVRILIVKMEHDPSLENAVDVDENGNPKSSRSKSKRSKSRKSHSEKSKKDP